MTASPMVLTRRASSRSRATATATNLSATLAALLSPCASVSALKPARSAKATVRSSSGVVIDARSTSLHRRLIGIPGYDLEAEHHPGLIVFGDVAVRHPEPRIGHVEEDVDRFAREDDDGVLPDEVRLRSPVSRQHYEPARAVYVE